MKKKKHVSKPIIQDNQGFSLIELLISIAVLVLIMLPLMNMFIRSMQMNKRAEEIQIQSNLAANIMEGLKNIDMEDTILQFTGAPADFTIVTDVAGNPIADEIKVLRLTDGEYEEVLPLEYGSLEDLSTYYFAMHGIQDGDTAYDAVISMDATNYQPGGNKMNSYLMPDAINLDAMANGLLLSNGQDNSDHIDDEALATYLAWGEAYALQLFEQSSAYQTYLMDYDQWVNDNEIAEMEGNILPLPPAAVTFDKNDYNLYCDEATVKTYITKKMEVTVSQDTLNTIAYDINYDCNWPAMSGLERTLQYLVSVKNYSDKIENVYLFYTPSIFMGTINPDDIGVVNTNSTYAINFYVVEQVGGAILPNVTIAKSSLENISVYTNLNSSYVNLKVDGSIIAGGFQSDIVKSEAKDRIYQVKVEIFEYVDSTDVVDKYKNEVYTLTSTREK